MNKKIIGLIAAVSIAAQCLAGTIMTASATVSNLCLDGTFEEYTDGVAIPDRTNGYWKYYGKGDNQAIYSSDAAYGEDSAMGAKLIFTGENDCQLNCDIIEFDKTKTYRIEFDEKTTGPETDGVAASASEWAGRFIMFDSSWGWMYNDSNDGGRMYLTPNEWTHYSFTVGPDDTADHVISSTAENDGAIMRFEMAEPGVINIDNFSVIALGEEEEPEIPGAAMIEDITFENHTDGEVVPDSILSGVWKFYNSNSEVQNIAKYSSNAKFGVGSELGIEMERVGDGTVQLNNEITGFDPAKSYRITFDANANNRNWAARFKIKNKNYEEILSGGGYEGGVWMSNAWQSFSFIIGPTGTNGAKYTFNPASVTQEAVTLQFEMADIGKLYIDNFSIEKLDDGKNFTLALSWADSNYQEITELSQGLVNGVATVKNTTALNYALQLIVAKYDAEGRLLDVSVAPAETVLANQTEENKIYCPYQYTKSADNEHLKVFAWDGTSEMQPYVASQPLE